MRAMPWILPEKEIEPQLADFLDETGGQEESEECIIGYSYALGMRPFLDY